MPASRNDRCANIHATFFVVGWVAERHADLVDTVRRAGHEIGSHSYIHEKAYDLGRDRFRADVRESVRVLSAIAGGPHGLVSALRKIEGASRVVPLESRAAPLESRTNPLKSS